MPVGMRVVLPSSDDAREEEWRQAGCGTCEERERRLERLEGEIERLQRRVKDLEAQGHQPSPLKRATNLATPWALVRQAACAAALNRAPSATASSTLARATRSARSLIAPATASNSARSSVVKGRSGSFWIPTGRLLRRPSRRRTHDQRRPAGCFLLRP